MRKIVQGEGCRHFKQRDSEFRVTEAGNGTASRETQVLIWMEQRIFI